MALIAATHMSVAVPNAVMQETVRASMRTWYTDFVTELTTISDGSITHRAGRGSAPHCSRTYAAATALRSAYPPSDESVRMLAYLDRIMTLGHDYGPRDTYASPSR